MNAANNSFKHNGSRVLLVEGKNDCHVVWALRDTYHVPETFGVYVCESDDILLSRLNALTQRPEMEIVGVVIDADSNPEGRWQSIQSKLQNSQYVLPSAPDPDGTIVEAVEDFCRELAPADAIAFSEQCVIQAKEREFATFKDVHQSKAVVHTYLAWQDEPGKPLGQSITSQVLEPETEIARRFVDWLKRLFGDG